MLDRFGVDTIEMGRGFNLRPEDWQPWTLPDGSPCKIPAFIHPVREDGDWRVYHDDGTLIAIQKAGSLYFEQTYWPFADDPAGADFDDLDAPLEKVQWSTLRTPPTRVGYDPGGLEQLAAGARALRQSTDRAIIGLFGGNLMELGQFLFGMANFLRLMAEDPALVHRFLDKLVARHLENLRKFLSAVGPHIDIILFGDDLGMQTGPQISPAHVPRDPPAALQADVGDGQGAGPRQGDATLLRRRLPIPAGPD